MKLDDGSDVLSLCVLNCCSMTSAMKFIISLYKTLYVNLKCFVICILYKFISEQSDGT